MADHVRQQLRTSVVTLLGGLTTTTDKVFDTRVSPLQDSELPGLLIGTEEDETEYLSAGTNPLIMWSIALSVAIAVKKTGTIERTIDEIEKEVLVKLATDHTIGGLAKGFTRESSSLALDGEGEKKVAIRTVIFNVQIATREATPDTALP